jgi:hypothetical protein
MPEVQEVFRMATQRVRPDSGFADRQTDYRRKQDRKRKIGAFVVAAAIGVTAIVVMLEMRRGQSTTTPAVEPSTISPSDAAAEQVARGFIGAFGAFDAERAMTYVADNADLTGLIDPQVPPNSKGLSRMLSLLEAERYQQTITSCEANTLESGAGVVCEFDFHAIGSDEIGRGPYTGSDFTFTVRDGEIAEASLYWNIDQFSPQMWEPFANWVSAPYPKDFAVMYTEGGSNFRLTEESIRLWEQHTREYAKEVAD